MSDDIGAAIAVCTCCAFWESGPVPGSEPLPPSQEDWLCDWCRTSEQCVENRRRGAGVLR